MRRRILYWLMVVIFTAGVQRVCAQQNVQFSQYVFNTIAVNPAYAGYKEEWYMQALYRHQWVGLDGAPRTGGISIDGVTGGRDNRVGVGAQVMFDRLGPQSMTSGYGFYSYRIPLDEEDTKRFCLGLGVGVSQYSIDGTALQYFDTDDQAIPVTKVSVLVPDARFGIFYFTNDWYAGLSVMDLFSTYTDKTRYNWHGNNYSTIRKTQHMYLTGGFMSTISPMLKIKPSILVKEDFKGPTNVDFNAFLLINDKLWIGGSYRTAVNLWQKPALQKDLTPLDAASLMVEFYALPELRIGYSYDITINKLASYQQGSHEISLGYMFNTKQRKSNIECPRFF